MSGTPVTTDVGVEAERGEYSRCWPHEYETYSPGFTASFQERYASLQDRTVVSADRCYLLDAFARQCAGLAGDFAECGVYKGGTARLLAEATDRISKRLHLFDTFEGMPELADSDPSGHRRGDFGDTTLDAVSEYLRGFEHLEFHVGEMPATFAPLLDCRFAFAHIDVDLYASVRACCEFFYGRMAAGGMLVFDDYGFEYYRHAARQAVDEFFADKPEVPLPLPTGQCLVVKLPEPVMSAVTRAVSRASRGSGALGGIIAAVITIVRRRLTMRRRS
jgi:O-methyltransferase